MCPNKTPADRLPRAVGRGREGVIAAAGEGWRDSGMEG